MKKLKYFILAFTISALPVSVQAAGGGEELEEVYINLSNKANLVDGATTFVNYCLSCHSAKYMRFNRMAEDLDISEEVVEANMMFVADKVGELMDNTMAPEDAASWFGVTPPDLSLIARSRSPDWIYSFLKSYYADDEKATGWNNTIFDSTAMPHVLYGLQGTQQANFSTHKNEEGEEVHEFEGFELLKPGKLSEEAYDQKITNLVNFLVYMGEPVVLKRKTMGVWVLLFLIVLFIPCYLMKKEFWKDVH